MRTLIVTTVADRKGKPGIWMEGGKLAVALGPAESYSIKTDSTPNGTVIRLVRDDSGDRVVSIRGAKSTSPKPLIELRGDVVAWPVGAKIRIVCRPGIVEISRHSSDTKQSERFARYLEKVTRKQTLKVGSHYIGGGVLDRALHEGFKAAGIESYVQVAVEKESRYIESLLANQPDLFKEDSILINAGVEDIEYRGNCFLDVCVGGLPCTGASQAGKSKRKLKHAEEHPDAGACFYHTLQFIGWTQPWLIILENVENYLESASYAVIRQVLSSWGYELSESILNGNEFGALENRDRMCLVAVTKGIEAFDFANVIPLREREDSLSLVLDDVDAESDAWKPYDYLAEKEVRDAQAGKGFKRSIYKGDEDSVTTIRRLYNKGGSCDQFLRHPDESKKLFRLFTPGEHARIKTVPEFIIAGLPATTAHEVLGQSVIYCAFFAVGVAIGAHLHEQAVTAMDLYKQAA